MFKVGDNVRVSDPHFRTLYPHKGKIVRVIVPDHSVEVEFVTGDIEHFNPTLLTKVGR